MSDIPLASGIPVHCAHHAISALHDCRPHPKNPNKHPERQLILYAAAIKMRGWREAVTISKLSGFVVKGNGAILVAQRLGITEIPVEYQDYANEDEELADLLAHNRIPELSIIDNELLKPILAKLSPGGALPSAGFTDEVVAKLLASIAPIAPQYPITARLNERHDFVVITTESETDWQFLKTLLGVRVEQSFKNSTVGEGRVIPFSRFISALRENRDSIPQAR